MNNGQEGIAGKVAWVTGSSRGIGRAIARCLAEQGAKVVVHGTTPTSVRAFNEGDTLDGVAESIAKETGAEVISVHGDLSDQETVHNAASEIRSRLGSIDILVNNAGADIGSQGTQGAQGGKPVQNDAIYISLDDIRAVLDRNVMTCILTCREVAPEMMERKSGAIINVGSIAGMFGHAHSAIYGTAKAAVHEYTRCLADQLRPYNVRVNAVAPGEITTPRFKATRPLDEDRLVTGGTLTRYGRPEEVAEIVAFFVNESRSPYVTGQILRIDGGQQLFPA